MHNELWDDACKQIYVNIFGTEIVVPLSIRSSYVFACYWTLNKLCRNYLHNSSLSISHRNLSSQHLETEMRNKWKHSDWLGWEDVEIATKINEQIHCTNKIYDEFVEQLTRLTFDAVCFRVSHLGESLVKINRCFRQTFIYNNVLNCFHNWIRN